MRRRAGVRRALVLALAALVGAVAASSGAQAGASVSARPAVRPFVSGWAPYWATAESLAQVQAHPGLFTEVSPFWYALRRSGAGTRVLAHPLSSGTHASVVAALHAQGVRAVPTITDETGAHVLAGLIATPRTRSGVVGTLVAQAVADGVDGLDLDFEGFAFHDGRASWTALHPSWIAFVRELHAALARHHKVLDVTIPPIDSTGDSYWVYDPVAIAPYVHALRLMAYDYHFSSPGPIAPLPWVHDVISTTLAGVPAAKVFLGVPAYGRSWVTAHSGSCPSGTDLRPQVVTPVQAAALAAASKVRPTWDAASAERTFTYSSTVGTGSASCTVTRTVWYDDASAIAVRAKVAAAAHLGGIAVWSIDDIPAATYAAMAPAFTTAPRHAAAAKARAATTPRAAAAPKARTTSATAPRLAQNVLPRGATADVDVPVAVTAPAPPVSTAPVAESPAPTAAAYAAPLTLALSASRSPAPAVLSGLLAAALLAGAATALLGRRRPEPVVQGRHSGGAPAGRHSAR